MISRESKSRQPSILKATAKYLQKPNLISLGGGLPHPDYFPIEGLILQAPMPPDFSNDTQGSSGSQVSMTKHDVARDDDVYDLSIALTYGLGTGSAQLLRFVTEHTEMTSNPPYADWQCCLTVGTTSATEQAYRMLCERGDYILAEEFTYPTAIETAVALGLKVVGITVDNEGLCPERMDEILSNWDAQARGARKPHLLYTIPSGANPTGATQSTARRKAIYAIAQKHDIYILEDEPYYFLQMQPYAGQEQRDIPTPASIPAFLDTLVATYLSLDVDGRVLRMDSFSKIICPGSRTGWITASAQIIERFIRHNECSNQNPSGFSQIILYKLLDATWGHQGYLHWLMKLGKEYTRRRNVILAACENHLPKVVTWNPPAAGMFVSYPTPAGLSRPPAHHTTYPALARD